MSYVKISDQLLKTWLTYTLFMKSCLFQEVTQDCDITLSFFFVFFCQNCIKTQSDRKTRTCYNMWWLQERNWAHVFFLFQTPPGCLHKEKGGSFWTCFVCWQTLTDWQHMSEHYIVGNHFIYSNKYNYNNSDENITIVKNMCSLILLWFCCVQVHSLNFYTHLCSFLFWRLVCIQWKIPLVNVCLLFCLF